MRYLPLPLTDLIISEISLGTGDLGGSVDQTTSTTILDAYVHYGGNFIDTAHVYNDWLPGERSRSEKLIGAWMKTRRNRSQLVLASKGGHHPVDDSPYVNRVTPADLRHDLEDSLRFLETDVIDLYWLHRDNPDLPVEVLLDTLETFRKEGKIRYYGASNWRTGRLIQAQQAAREQGWLGFCADQMLWTVAKTQADAIPDPTIMVMDEALYQFHLQTGIPATPYTSQANGLFRKLARDGAENLPPNLVKHFPLEANLRRYTRIQQVMAETGFSLTQVVLGWLLSQPFMTIPIVGPKNVDQVQDSISAAGVRLTPEQVRLITVD
ncbi:MAG: aldo/keto reductase [Anaerolineae bacterium]|nr:aldo/keto reductase [Anaerolineae bacterium]